MDAERRTCQRVPVVGLYGAAWEGAMTGTLAGSLSIPAKAPSDAAPLARHALRAQRMARRRVWLR